MNDMEPEALALIEAARAEAGISPEQHAAGRTRLAKQLGVVAAGAALEAVTVGSSAAAAGVAKTTVTLGTATLLSKVALGLSVVGVSVAVYAVTREPKPSPVKEAAVIVSTTSVAQPTAPQAEPVLSREPSVVPTAVAPRAVVTAGSGASAPSSKLPDTFPADLKLLRDVHEAIGAGRPDQALAMLDARRAQGPEGAFAQERAAARVVALCRLGRTGDARAEATRFLSAYPKSPLSERVRHTCDEPARK